MVIDSREVDAVVEETASRTLEDNRSRIIEEAEVEEEDMDRIRSCLPASDPVSGMPFF